MTISSSADRINLLHVMSLYPDWMQGQLAQAVGRSKGWVYTGQTRLEEERSSSHEVRTLTD
jgi:hypothetical protein